MKKSTMAELLKEIQQMQEKLDNIVLEFSIYKSRVETMWQGEMPDFTLPAPLKLEGKALIAFNGAIESGLITVKSDNTLQWNGNSTTDLAYFCGRVWCGDYLVRDATTGELCWHFGPNRFPSKALDQLFGVHLLRNFRRQREYMSAPAGHHQVDRLF